MSTVKVHTLKIEDAMLLTGAALEILQRALVYSSLDLQLEFLKDQLNSGRWLVVRGGHHIALIRKSDPFIGNRDGKRVAIIEERDAK